MSSSSSATQRDYIIRQEKPPLKEDEDPLECILILKRLERKDYVCYVPDPQDPTGGKTKRKLILWWDQSAFPPPDCKVAADAACGWINPDWFPAIFDVTAWDPITEASIGGERNGHWKAFMHLHGNPTKSEYFCLCKQFAKEYFQDQRCNVCDFALCIKGYKPQNHMQALGMPRNYWSSCCTHTDTKAKPWQSER